MNKTSSTNGTNTQTFLSKTSSERRLSAVPTESPDAMEEAESTNAKLVEIGKELLSWLKNLNLNSPVDSSVENRAYDQPTENQHFDEKDLMKPYSEWKHDLFQVLGTALAVAALVVPLLIWGIDSKQASLEAKIDSMDARNQSRYDVLLTKMDEMGKRMEDHQAMYERVIDERTSKK